MIPMGRDIEDRDVRVLGQGRLSAAALAAANINPETGLATDYLNHFNEVVMMMEMLPDMPDCAADVIEWEPLDYCGHFDKSSFKDKELAVLAYRAAPQAIRAHLETLILQIDAEVICAQQQLRQDAGPRRCAAVAQLATTEIKPLIAAASGAIHGRPMDETEFEDTVVQANVDALFG